MDVRNQVRLRRQERMRQIMEEKSERSANKLEIRPAASFPIITNRTADEDPRFQDPEFAWKHRDSLRSMYGRLGATGEDSSESGRGGGGLLFAPSKRTIRNKLWISGALFATIWGMFQISAPWAEQGKRYVTLAMTEDMNYAAVQAWYAAAFQGMPSFLPAYGDKLSLEEAERVNSLLADYFLPPVAGKVAQPFTTDHEGIRIEARSSAPVAAVAAGRVIEVIQGADHTATIRIQHGQGYQTLYAGVDGSKLKKNDWVQRGERIGLVAASSASAAGGLYFSIQKDGRYINPVDVMPFD
jgi:stage IV sporulation protein FA